MDLDVHALRCFIAVGDHQTVTAAAAHLGIGQPAVSRQLQQLERRLRIELFHRENGRLRLTAAGGELLEVSRQAVAATDNVGRAADKLARGELREVHIASTRTTLDDAIAPWLATWDDAHPMPLVRESAANSVYDQLRADTDLAISPMPPPAGFDSLLLCDLPVTAQVPHHHPLSTRGSVTLEELTRHPLLLLTREFHARQSFDQALARHGMVCELSVELSTPTSAQAVAASGRGICVATDDPRFELTCLPILDPAGDLITIRLCAAWDPTHHAAVALSRLAKELHDFIQIRYHLS